VVNKDVHIEGGALHSNNVYKIDVFTFTKKPHLHKYGPIKFNFGLFLQRRSISARVAILPICGLLSATPSQRSHSCCLYVALYLQWVDNSTGSLKRNQKNDSVERTTRLQRP